jgi:hypothetical protein
MAPRGDRSPLGTIQRTGANLRKNCVKIGLQIAATQIVGCICPINTFVRQFDVNWRFYILKNNVFIIFCG